MKQPNKQMKQTGGGGKGNEKLEKRFFLFSFPLVFIHELMIESVALEFDSNYVYRRELMLFTFINYRQKKYPTLSLTILQTINKQTTSFAALSPKKLRTIYVYIQLN